MERFHVVMEDALVQRLFRRAKVGVKGISMSQMDQILITKENDGLCVGSPAAFNNSLLYKWRCRFHMEANSLWEKVIKNIQGRVGVWD